MSFTTLHRLAQHCAPEQAHRTIVIDVFIKLPFILALPPVRNCRCVTCVTRISMWFPTATNAIERNTNIKTAILPGFSSLGETPAQMFQIIRSVAGDAFRLRGEDPWKGLQRTTRIHAVSEHWVRGSWLKSLLVSALAIFPFQVCLTTSSCRIYCSGETLSGRIAFDDDHFDGLSIPA